MQCLQCGSEDVKNYGARLLGKTRKVKHQCQNCGWTKFVDIKDSKITRYLITSIQNDTEVNLDFFNTLKHFSDLHSAEIIMLPTKYMGKLEEATWDSNYHQYIVNTEKYIGNNIKVLGDLYLLATLENPISGFDVISKGKTVIIGHGQYQMRSLPASLNSCPILLTTTGSVTYPNVNTNTKVGKKAVFNHSFSALYLSVYNEGMDDEEFHIRPLLWDGEGFFDIDGYYTDNAHKQLKEVSALVTGDEHIIEIDPKASKAIYGVSGIVQTLKPKTIVRHDVFSGNSISHHNKDRAVILNLQELHGVNDLQEELDITCDFIVATTPKDVDTWIVASNHNDHLDKWLSDYDSNFDKKNARLYHWFMLQKTYSDNEDIGAFEIYFRKTYPQVKNVIFLDRDFPAMIHDIEVHHHGDLGTSGMKNATSYFFKHTQKVIHGHTHSPYVNKGAYCVGTTSKMRLSYNRGLSSWMHSNVIVYPNGKRQHIHIINGKWFI